MLHNEQIRGLRKPPLPVAAALHRSPPVTCREVMLECGHGVRELRIHKNKDIIIAGNQYRCLYLNHDGWLSRYKILHNGCRQIVDFVLPGEMFELEACLFKGALYSVVAVTETSLSTIPFELVDNIFDRSPKLSRVLFWSALYEAAILGQHLIDAARRSAYERVSHLLLELFVRLQRSGRAKDMAFQMPLTQELIGDALGLTTVHVNRTLRSLRDDKLIALDGKQITLLDFEALCLLSDFENSYLGDSARALQSEMAASKG